MKGKAFLLFVFFCSSLSAQNYHRYELENYSTISNGTGQGQIQIGLTDLRPGDTAPTAFCFDRHGNIYFCDYNNRRITIIDENLRALPSIQIMGFLSASRQITIRDNWIFGENAGSQVYGFNREMSTLYEVRFDTLTQPTGIRCLEYLPDIAFAFLRDGSVLSVVNPSIEQSINRINLRNTEQTRTLFRPDSGIDWRGLTLDSRDRLFQNGELLTRDYRIFLSYWNESHSANNQQNPNRLDITFDPNRLATSTVFMGRDNDGNYYWNDNLAVIVFDRNGWMKDFFLLDQERRMVIPAVHPNGDVYSLSYDDTQVYLWRVRRQW